MAAREIQRHGGQLSNSQQTSGSFFAINAIPRLTPGQSRYKNRSYAHDYALAGGSGLVGGVTGVALRAARRRHT